MKIVRYTDLLNEGAKRGNLTTLVVKIGDKTFFNREASNTFVEVIEFISKSVGIEKFINDVGAKENQNVFRIKKFIGLENTEFPSYAQGVIKRNSTGQFLINTHMSTHEKKVLLDSLFKFFKIEGTVEIRNRKVDKSEVEVSDINVDLDKNDSNFEITNKNQLFEDIKKASSDIYNCLTSTTYLCNKLNKIDKVFFQEYLDFLRVGPVNELRREVATYLSENNINPTKLDEIIKKHKREKPNQLRAWLNPYKILHPIINQEYKHFDNEMEILANEISKSNDGMKWKINNFNGPQNQGSENYWIAFYNKSLLSQADGLQLFIQFKQGECTYGIYKHNGTEYVVGPENYTNWEKFTEFISENSHYILEDIKSSDEISTDSDEEDLEIPNRFSGIPQPFDIESELSKAQAQSDSDIEDFSRFRAVQNEEEDAINPFRQAICVLGRSGAGKSFTIDDVLDNSEHEYEFIIPSASTTGLLSQFSPSAKDGRGGYIPSRLGKLIEKAYKNKGKLYTAVFDECHKSNIIEMINDELLQAISTKRNMGR
jgi:hypothetical protein